MIDIAAGNGGVSSKLRRSLWGKVLSLLLNWLVRGLTVIAGVIAVTLVWPVARAAWEGQRADAVVDTMRGDRKVTLADLRAGIDAETRAIAIDPTAPRYLVRSDLLATAALSRTLQLDQPTRTDWLRRARADLVSGLAGTPAIAFLSAAFLGMGWAQTFNRTLGDRQSAADVFTEQEG